MARALRRVAAAVILVAAAILSPFTTPAKAATPDPVIFVHGWSGADWNWAVMIADFQRNGWPSNRLFAWNYDWTQSNAVTAQKLAAYVDQVRAQTGAAKVDIVTHSMGGLSSRYYLKFLGGTAYVDDWVSIGGPNHGTNASYLCNLLMVSCAEMNYNSAFLTQLNAGDETPGPVNYGTFWSNCDEIINPDSSVLLDGAVNTYVGCIGHISMLASPSVAQKVRNFIR
ncbi:esterase/lipase family protein [Thermobispora bispora]|uniref:Lipase class 2 n=1 Tax=Thermobispora bispora (strain ATCC 19993 / DSM 43833 / CBS 139.67 / JCM 10125 / KCTC 9307 / NBRC 14880 / R51) TaxID=469371 RepID=D6Y2E9_THEBD|nr:triacylglycerol lipase [Thermobispora bispora]ADG88798.1 lipase class 2 [Thermobispora bispora DSM 43833]